MSQVVDCLIVVVIFVDYDTVIGEPIEHRKFNITKAQKTNITYKFFNNKRFKISPDFSNY